MKRMDRRSMPPASGKAWCTALAVGAAVTVLTAIYRSASAYQEEGNRLWFSLCDGAFAAAVLLIGLGLLIWIGSTGMFDTMTYAVHSLKEQLLPFGGRNKPTPDYYDYKLSKEEKRRPVPVAMLVSGVVFLLLAGLFLLVSIL